MHSILIVDDDKNLCTVLNEELNEIGFDSAFVNNADNAIEEVSKNKYDLVLLDLKMPEKDGFYVLESFKKMA